MRGSRFRSLVRRLGLGSLVVATVGLGFVVGPAASASVSVNCDKGGNLQHAINVAPAGATVLVKGTCYGNFVASGKALTLKGNPSAKLDGTGSGVTLLMNSNNALRLIHLTVTGGGFAGIGSGVVSGGTLKLTHVTVAGNNGFGTTMEIGGGVVAVHNLTVTSSKILGNRATASGPGSGSSVLAAGGGLVGLANVTVTNSTISGNEVAVSNSNGQPRAFGGGIAAAGKLTIKGSKIKNNRAGTFGDGGAALAAGAWVAGTATTDSMTISKSLVSGNIAGAVSTTSGAATAGVPLLAGDITGSGPGGPLIISSSNVLKNGAFAHGGTTGTGIVVPGPISDFNATKLTNSVVQGNYGKATGKSAATEILGPGANKGLHVTRSRIIGNKGTATSSNGDATAAIVAMGSGITLSKSTFDRNSMNATATGGNAVAGLSVFGAPFQSAGSTISRNSATAKTTTADSATAAGGGVFGGTATIKNSTIALNSVRGVSPSSGGTTDAEGGGIFLDNTNPNTLTNVTVAGNRASGSGGSHIVRAGGLDAGDKTKIKDTILGPNSAPAAPDCRTGIKSGGYNVIRHTSGCAFASGAGDKLNKSPKLGLLKNNGGPTQTMLIKSSSPAHNAVPNTAARCPNKSDQRGVHRPQGTRCDIGAVERKSSDPPSAPLSVPRVHVAHRPSTGAGAPPAISRILSRILGSVPGGSDGLLQGSSSGPSFAQMARAALARL